MNSLKSWLWNHIYPLFTQLQRQNGLSSRAKMLGKLRMQKTGSLWQILQLWPFKMRNQVHFINNKIKNLNNHRRKGCDCKTDCLSSKCSCFLQNSECDPDLCQNCFHTNYSVKKGECKNNFIFFNLQKVEFFSQIIIFSILLNI